MQKNYIDYAHMNDLVDFEAYCQVSFDFEDHHTCRIMEFLYFTEQAIFAKLNLDGHFKPNIIVFE